MDELRTTVFNELAALPDLIADQARRVMAEECQVELAKESLVRHQQAILRGELPETHAVHAAKNEAQRAAAMAPLLDMDEEVLRQASRTAKNERIKLQLLQDRFAAARAQARLLGGNDA